MDDSTDEMTWYLEDVADCSDCGKPIPDGKVVGCPDGAEICRECFDSGRH
jgi:hypothetical protein